jgi:hypothetical protein
LLRPSDRDQTFLARRIVCEEDRVRVDERGGRFFERDAVLGDIRLSLGLVPFEVAVDDRGHDLSMCWSTYDDNKLPRRDLTPTSV